MNADDVLLRYTIRLGDTALVLAQRMIELVTHGPELEEEMANANFALDFLGQARMYYTYAGELEGSGRGEDEFAYLRNEREFESLLIVEQPNGHFGDTIVRSVLFEAFYALQLDALKTCTDERIAAIAERASREIAYHQRHNEQWLVRLGDGTDLSHERVQASLDSLWRYTGEMFTADEVDDAFMREFNGPDLALIHDAWLERIVNVVHQSTLALPESGWMDSGGKIGRHSEHFGPMIAEMQYLQRSLPGLTW